MTENGEQRNVQPETVDGNSISEPRSRLSNKGLLVISRRPGQQIEIGDGIEIIVLEVNPRIVDGRLVTYYVRLGISAPGHEVWRSEFSEGARAAMRAAKHVSSVQRDTPIQHG